MEDQENNQDEQQPGEFPRTTQTRCPKSLDDDSLNVTSTFCDKDMANEPILSSPAPVRVPVEDSGAGTIGISESVTVVPDVNVDEANDDDDEMTKTEMRVRIICQEKNNMALRMELKCAELQVAAKEKIDAKKTRLIELLDNKLAVVEKKNLRLVEMMEQIVKEKDTHSKRLIDATRNMEELGRKLADSERIRQELRIMNNELKSMLENVEGKGTKLAALAKEKVLKYKDENDRMQREIDRMKGDASTIDFKISSQLANLTPTDSLCIDLVWKAFDETKELHGRFVRNILDTSLPGHEAGLPEKINEVVANVDNEMEQCLKRLRQAVVDAMTSEEAKIAQLQRENVNLRQRQGQQAEADRGDQLAAKDREVAVLKLELQKLKSAIGQLAGLNSASETEPAIK